MKGNPMSTDLAEALTVNPGDTLIIRVHTGTSPRAAEFLRERAKELLPDVGVVVIAAEQIAALRAVR